MGFHAGICWTGTYTPLSDLPMPENAFSKAWKKSGKTKNKKCAV